MDYKKHYEDLREKFNALEADYDVACKNYSAVNAQNAKLKNDNEQLRTKLRAAQAYSITTTVQVRKYETANKS